MWTGCLKVEDPELGTDWIYMEDFFIYDIKNFQKFIFFWLLQNQIEIPWGKVA